MPTISGRNQSLAPEYVFNKMFPATVSVVITVGCAVIGAAVVGFIDVGCGVVGFAVTGVAVGFLVVGDRVVGAAVYFNFNNHKN